MDAPPVSVLLPVRDAAATLAACLRSVQRQTFADFECVVVDDGSRDGSVAVAAEFAAADGRFLVQRAAAGGLVAALVRGLDLCRGRWIARIDADDMMRRRRLQRQLAALHREPELAGVGCHVRLFPRRSLRPGRLAYEAWLNSLRDADDVQRDALIECPLAHPTWMVRADVLRAAGYRDPGGPEDYDLLLRLLAAGHRLGVVPERLVAWRDLPQRLSRIDPRYGLDRFAAVKAEALCRTVLADQRRYVLVGHGSTGRGIRAALRARDRLPALILDLHPRRIGQRVDGVWVRHPDAVAPWPRLPVLASVAGAGPRQQVRAMLRARGLRETVDFVCVA